jgi:hypothetical protein
MQLDLRRASQSSYLHLEFDDELCGGTWSRTQLEEMDAQFVAAVEAAFEAGLESRTVARATILVGKLRVTEEAILDAAWRWFVRNRDASDIPFAAVVARCPGVDFARVRAGFEKRFAANPRVKFGG